MSKAMIEQAAQVVGIDGEYVLIETQVKSSCGACSSVSRCGVSVLSSLFSRRANCVALINDLNLAVGDQVIIGIDESKLLSSAMLAYMLPITIMLLTVVILDALHYADSILVISALLSLFITMKISNFIIGKSNNESGEIVLLRNVSQKLINFY